MTTRTDRVPEVKAGGLLYQGKFKGRPTREVFMADLLWGLAGAVGCRCTGTATSDHSTHRTALATLGVGHIAIEYWPEGMIFVFLAVCFESINLTDIDKVLLDRGFSKVRSEVVSWLL